MEDVSREAGGAEVEAGALRDAGAALQAAVSFSSHADVYARILAANQAVQAWLGGRGAELAGRAGGGGGGAQQQVTFEGPAMLEALAALGLGRGDVVALTAALNRARELEGGDKVSFDGGAEGAGAEAVPESVKTPGAGPAALSLMSRLATAATLLYGASLVGSDETGAAKAASNAGDYRLVVQRSMAWVPRGGGGRGRGGRGGRGGGGGGEGEDTYVRGARFARARLPLAACCNRPCCVR
jgi:hypothetical protein